MENKIVFDADKHEYKLGDKVLISVTQLLTKHKLSADYSAVNEEVLEAKAKRGTFIHKELEEFVKDGKDCFSMECENFGNWVASHNTANLESEQIVFNDIVAGTLDLKGLLDGDVFIADYKTSSKLDREGVRWQLSIYNYLCGSIAKKLIVFHFPTEDEMKIIEIEPIAVEEIEKLLNCERNGELYQKPTFEIAAVDCEKIVAIQGELKALDNRKKELEQQENELKQFLIEKMEATGVKSIDNDFFKITYVAATSRETIDSAKLKKERPEIASEYVKTTLVKPSIRITIKEA